MIAYLKGKILQKSANYLVLEHSGIGYKVFATPEALSLPLGQETELYIYHKSADDGQTLFGMPDFGMLQFFELLITVTGVGPKMALGIISAAKIEILQQAIVNGDTEIFTRMSGVGKKTAERIILELKSKISSGVLETMSAGSSDIYDALVSLGYNPREIREIISQIDTALETGEQIKQALKLLSKN